MTEETSSKPGEIDLSPSKEKPEMTVTRTRKVPLAVMPVTPFGKYNLIGKLGHGGMAEVFLAYVAGPAGFRKLVVIKRLHQQLEEEPGFLDMFLDEARLAARLNHSNIVQCFEVGDVDGLHFIAMEYLEGQGLDRIRRHCVREGIRLPEPVVARMLIDALDGLHYAHQLKDYDGSPLKIVHRDVSPQNVFVTYDGVVKLLDFGIAKATTHVVETRTGVVKGKFAYMAPEQARGGEIDHRADLWSMGVVLWETLANRRLFKGPNDLATLNQALMGDIPDLAELVPNAPQRLLDITRKALSREVETRYQSAQEMKAELEKAYNGSDRGLATRSDVSEFVRGLFEDVIEQHRKVLQICLSDSTAAAGLASGRFRVSEHTPADLRMTPSGGFESTASGSTSGTSSTPSGQIISTISQSGQPISSNSAMLPLAMQQQQGSGWAGKAGILIGAVFLAVLTTLLVLWIAGPSDNDRYRGDNDRLAANHSGEGTRGATTQGERAGAAENEGPRNVAIPSENTSAAGEGTGVAPPGAGGESTQGANQSEGANQGEGASAGEGEGSSERPEASNTPANKVRPSIQRPIRPRAQPPLGGSKAQGSGQEPSGRESATAEEPATEPAMPPESQTKRRPVEPESFGFLTLDTVPWSHVSLGGRALGSTPVIRARLPVGTHTLTFRNPEAGLSTTYRVTIREGETTTKRLGLQ